ncbi:hypothetical protein [Microlunatus ginsengisoli]|uniref:hypothetical protein n=1 Tax=Microlunatus ginsengisoli TaxID=363863 RepID=UPI0031DC29AD
MEAEEAFRSLWKESVRAGSTRHAFHREVLNDLDALIARTDSTPVDTLVTVNDILVRWDELPRLHPRVARRLTKDWMRTYVVAEVGRVAAVADSTGILTVCREGSSSTRRERQLTMQHRASGLRALFIWTDGAEIGRVFSKSYSVPSIDPDRYWAGEGLEAVHEWEGLGITTRLYTEAAKLRPELRWGITALTDQSAALRRKLHSVDPWRFAAARDLERHPGFACRWCVEHHWAALERTAFRWHPTVDRA